MANSIDLATKMLPLLDEVFKLESKTALLDAPAKRVQFDGTKNVKYFKTDMDGLGDYDRGAGYQSGDVTGTWETLTLDVDRGRSFYVDRMDNDESLMMAFGTLSGEFIRTKVVPETDAIRFSKYAAAENILKVAAAATLTKDTVIPALDVATGALDDAEVPQEGRILFLTPEIYGYMKNSGAATRFLSPGQAMDRRFEEFDGMKVIRVPQARFYTAITLLDGKTAGQEDGGYTKDDITGKDINFMIVHPSAVLQITKHANPRIFDPDTCQKADAWQFDYRIYHDAWVYENKRKGIYLHNKA